MPSQSSNDNKEENKDFDVHSDDDKEENKGSYVHSDDVREENKGSYVHLSSSLPMRNQQRKRERNENDISFGKTQWEDLSVYTMNSREDRTVS